MTPCRMLVLSTRDLRSIFEIAPNIKVMMECLVGKDIAKKLYSTIENVSMLPNPTAGEQYLAGHEATFKRTSSLDAIRTGAKGYVRSNEWVQQAQSNITSKKSENIYHPFHAYLDSVLQTDTTK